MLEKEIVTCPYVEIGYVIPITQKNEELNQSKLSTGTATQKEGKRKIINRLN